MISDFLFSRLKWYRKWRGGTWVKVWPKPFPYMKDMWFRKNAPSDMEVLVDKEVYGQ